MEKEEIVTKGGSVFAFLSLSLVAFSLSLSLSLSLFLKFDRFAPPQQQTQLSF